MGKCGLSYQPYSAQFLLEQEPTGMLRAASRIHKKDLLYLQKVLPKNSLVHLKDGLNEEIALLKLNLHPGIFYVQ
jgi:hypothetical protein